MVTGRAAHALRSINLAVLHSQFLNKSVRFQAALLKGSCLVNKVVQLVIDSSEGIIKSLWQCGGRFLESSQCRSKDVGLQSREKPSDLPAVWGKEVSVSPRRSCNETLEAQPLQVVGHPCCSV